MSRALRILVAAVLMCGGVLPLAAAETASLARGTAITDPGLLRALDQDTLSLSRLLGAERTAEGPLGTDLLFTRLPSLETVRPVIDAEFDRYIVNQKTAFPSETIGVGEGFDVQLFDRAHLNSSETRFVLAGIVNRMDRAWVEPESCGEIRLIYRLVRFDGKPDGGKAATRLPMTLNLVMKARDARQGGTGGKPIGCADVARRWLGGDWQALIGSSFDPRDAMLDRIETNIQISIAPKSALHDFRSDYLLKVFRYDAGARRFTESTLENQIDRDRILADAALRRDFRNWLLAPENLQGFDRGTALIPETFLARAAIAPTPAGLDASALQPSFGMMQGEGKGDPVVTNDDVVEALKRAAGRGIALQNIRSPAGFQRRLNDVTCSGCHQTRSIGGFHFPGVDWLAEKPSDQSIVPASPHFIGDQLRRRDILTAFATGKNPDFSRGFASRPQTRGSAELAGTEYQDGWGAHCALPAAGSEAADRSFASWSCARGLACQPAATSSRIGMCFIRTR